MRSIVEIINYDNERCTIITQKPIIISGNGTGFVIIESETGYRYYIPYGDVKRMVHNTRPTGQQLTDADRSEFKKP